MKIDTTWIDHPSRDSISAILYLDGCSHGCKNCHNPSLQIYRLPEYDIEDLWDNIITTAYKNKTNNIVFSGGDPLDKNNIKITNILCEFNEYETFNICIYTGDTIEVAKTKLKEYGWDYLKCGEYIEDLKDVNVGKYDDRLVLASKNQKLYNSDFEQISIDNVYYF